MCALGGGHAGPPLLGAKCLSKPSLGTRNENMIAITRGVQVGEPVIVTGDTLVTDGQPVRIIPPPER